MRHDYLKNSRLHSMRLRFLNFIYCAMLVRMSAPRDTWRDYLWYCLLFGTVGAGLIGGVAYAADHRHTFFLNVGVIGLCIMATLLIGWVLYGLLRVLIRHLKGGVS